MMDFVLRGKEVRNKAPVQLIKFITDQTGKLVDAEIDEDTFIEELYRSQNWPILFVAAIGKPHVGKTATIKALTRNLGHEVGDGISEKTCGVTLDGPYVINELVKGYGMLHLTTFNRESPVIYFLDIESYESFSKRYKNSDLHGIYQKITLPFVRLSGIKIVLVPEDDGFKSLETLSKEIQPTDLSSSAEVPGSSKIIIGVTKTQKKPFGIDYNNIDRETSDTIAEEFSNRYQIDKYFKDADYVVRPIPYIDPTDPDEAEITRFVPAYELLIEDIFKGLVSSMQSSHARDPSSSMEYFDKINNQIFNNQGMEAISIDSIKTKVDESVKRQIIFAMTEVINQTNIKLKRTFLEALDTRANLDSQIKSIRIKMLKSVDALLPLELRNCGALLEAKNLLIANFNEFCSKKNANLLLRLVPHNFKKTCIHANEEIARQIEGVFHFEHFFPNCLYWVYLNLYE